MELLNNWINGVNDILWSYILIIMLLGCAVWFTIKSHKWKNLVQNHISLSVSNTLHYFLQSHPYVSEFTYLRVKGD